MNAINDCANLDNDYDIDNDITALLIQYPGIRKLRFVWCRGNKTTCTCNSNNNNNNNNNNNIILLSSKTDKCKQHFLVYKDFLRMKASDDHEQIVIRCDYAESGRTRIFLLYR